MDMDYTPELQQPERRYPIGIQNFNKLRREDMIYVDKTHLIYRLTHSVSYAFLSRPRRFGKSLLLSTIKAYLEGRKELFKGLAIEKLEKEWRCHPVLMLSLATYNAVNDDNLEVILDNEFREWERQYGVNVETTDLSVRFRNIIKAAYDSTGMPVVVLIDEYDAPIVGNLHDEKRQDELRNVLKSIYSNLKDCDEYIGFSMLTGVSRFSKMSVFSGLNNLTDISLMDEYAEICGITEEELRAGLRPGINRLARKLGTDSEGALAELKASYDGYHFTAQCPDIYNPFSLLNALFEGKIKNYWSATGAPTFLIELIRRRDLFLPEFFNESVDDRQLEESDTYRMSPTALLFQTGYLTIKREIEPEVYELGVPNREVRRSLFHDMADIYFGDSEAAKDSNIRRLRDRFCSGDVEGAIRLLKSFLASIPYNLSGKKPEIYFENNLYIIFSLVGVDTNTEWYTSDGRIDVVVRVPKYIYLLELKVDRPVTEALTQIERKDYGCQFESDGRSIIRLGIEFSRKTRNIVSWATL